LNYFEKNVDLYLEQFKELRKYYPNLKDQMESENLFLRGEVCFNEDFGTGFYIDESYRVEIAFLSDYPNSIPHVKEIGGKIEGRYPHIYNNSGQTLCLGADIDIWMRFSERKTILHFVHNLLIPALYAHAYWKKRGVMPAWGDRPHGMPGVFLSYVELFKTIDIKTIVKLLRIVVDGDYEGKTPCPCGSQKTLNECHGENIHSIWQIPYNYIEMDYVYLKIWSHNWSFGCHVKSLLNASLFVD
jgi:hypothetical protein